MNLSFSRILRIVIGGFFIFAAFGDKSWTMGILGSILFIQGVLNKGCGMGNSSCGPVKKDNSITDFDPNSSFRKLKL